MNLAIGWLLYLSASNKSLVTVRQVPCFSDSALGQEFTNVSPTLRSVLPCGLPTIVCQELHVPQKPVVNGRFIWRATGHMNHSATMC